MEGMSSTPERVDVAEAGSEEIGEERRTAGELDRWRVSIVGEKARLEGEIAGLRAARGLKALV